MKGYLVVFVSGDKWWGVRWPVAWVRNGIYPSVESLRWLGFWWLVGVVTFCAVKFLPQ